MNYITLPVPVVRFLTRLINVLSSLTISNQYLLLQRADAGLQDADPSTLEPSPPKPAPPNHVKELHSGLRFRTNDDPAIYAIQDHLVIPKDMGEDVRRRMGDAGRIADRVKALPHGTLT